MKNLYSFFIIAHTLSLANYTAIAQPTIKRDITVGANSTDLLQSQCITSDGGQLLGGYSLSFKSGEKTQETRGGFDFWIVKLDRSGKIEWDKTIGGSSNDLLFCLQQTTDKGYILGGYSLSVKSGEKTEDSRGELDYWIVKTDSIGIIEWDKTIGGSYGDNMQSLQQTADGGFILGGFSNSNISYEKTENGRGWNDYWVVKLNADGNIEWDKTIGGNDNDYLQSIAQTSDGGYILGGYSSSGISGEKTEGKRGGFDYWVVKLDAAGNIQWNKTLGGTGYEVLRCITQTKEGSYIIGGYSPSNISGEKTQKSRGGFDYWIVKLNRKGSIVWDKTIGGSQDDYLKGIQLTKDGGYVLGGDSYSDISAEKTENARSSYSDYWIVKLDRQQNIEWDKTVGGTGPDFLSTVKESSTNEYILAGSSSSGISFDKTQSSRGGEDYWMVKLKYKKPATIQYAAIKSNDNNIAANHAVQNKFTVYPNPAKDLLKVQTNGSAIFSLINSSGEIVCMQTISYNRTIDIAGLAAGLYYLKNNTTGDIQKVIIIK